jgi:hypothetical protein
MVPREPLIRLREYLANVGRTSLPNYNRIIEGCPNFHRLNDSDERSYVKGCFHQFVFFPWNQDIFRVFDLFRNVFHLKNRLSLIEPDKFLGRTPEDECTSRVAFQFYPSGQGFLNRHQDPVNYHQLTVPTVVMSQKGIDFKGGGAYVETASNQRLILDDTADIGDVIYFNAEVVHGVEKIDPDDGQSHWLDFKGRWMALVAVNKLESNSRINNAIDLDLEGRR